MAPMFAAIARYLTDTAITFTNGTQQPLASHTDFSFSRKMTNRNADPRVEKYSPSIVSAATRWATETLDLLPLRRFAFHCHLSARPRRRQTKPLLPRPRRRRQRWKPLRRPPRRRRLPPRRRRQKRRKPLPKPLRRRRPPLPLKHRHVLYVPETTIRVS